jgi:ABC-type amino acid transport substrate-binding protein
MDAEGSSYGWIGETIDDWANGVSFACHTSKGDIVKKLNDAIVAIRANGTYQKIAEKYFDFDIYGTKQQLTSAP